MEKTPGLTNLTLSPPSRGLSLGWRLALSTALIISVVMGSISIGQQLIESRNDREIHQELLKESLAPLAVRLEVASTLEAMERDVENFSEAYERKGYSVHDLVLVNAVGIQVLSEKDGSIPEEKDDYIRAEIPIISPLLDGGRGTLIVLKNIQGYSDAMQRNWLLWAAHFAVTVGVVFLFLSAAIYFQVTKPVNRLVRSVKKMEMGYWGPVNVGGGAWEIRWLAWRFGSMVQEVRHSVTNLFEAEYKARSMRPKRSSISVRTDLRSSIKPPVETPGVTDLPVYRELLAVCVRLEAASPDDSNAVQLARGVWKHEALEANRLGFHELKARMEDAALRLLAPDEYSRLDKRLGEIKATWRGWAAQRREALTQMLEDKAVPCAGILHRVKHTAGVWAKMRGKTLGLDEVYDLFAFRIIVPTEADCYAALGVVHQAYKPEVTRFKDYIAKPKGNGYRSLHTCVRDGDGPVFEVQIRSVAMDRQAERGYAAHWLYKKGGHETKRKTEKPRWWERIFHWSGEITG